MSITISKEVAAVEFPSNRLRAKVLFVEDNEVNQILTAHMLKTLGCEVTIAANGHSAIDNFAREHYDLVLMDCQLPDIDGIELTRMMRGRESGQSPHSLDGAAEVHSSAIVALTADEDVSSRTQCLAAGMNDFLVKPVGLEQLDGVLRRWLREAVGRGDAIQVPPSMTPPTAPPSSSVDRKVLDKIRALQKPNAADLVARVIDSYVDRTPQLLEQLKDGVRLGDAIKVQEAAHSLKSSSANLGAVNLAGQSKALEQLARANDLTAAPKLLSDILTEYESVRTLLMAEVAEHAR